MTELTDLLMASTINFTDITLFISNVTHQLKVLRAQLLLIFSSREIAGIIWLFAFLLFTLSNLFVRQAYWRFLRAFCQKQIIVITILALIYISLEVLFLRYLHLWSSKNIKDTLIWILCSGLLSIVQFISGYENNKVSFSTIVKNLISIPILLEFFIDYYTFSIWIELILLPIVAILGITLALSKTRPELGLIGKISSKLINSVSLFLLFYTIYKVSYDSALLNIQNSLQFLLPVILTLFYLPFLYLITLYAIYERYWMTYKFTFKRSPQLIRTARIEHFKIAKININKVKRLGKVLLRCGWKIDSKESLLSLLKAFNNGHKFSVGEQVLDIDIMKEVVVSSIQEDFIEVKYPDGIVEVFHGSLKYIPPEQRA